LSIAFRAEDDRVRQGGGHNQETAAAASAAAFRSLLLAVEEKAADQELNGDGDRGATGEAANRIQWIDAENPAMAPLSEVLADCERRAASPPDDPERQAEIGEILLKLAKFAEAAAVFERVEALDPEHFGYFGRLARCHLFLDRPDDALGDCERWRRVMPNSADLHFLRGLALRNLGRRDEARQAFLEAVSLSPYAFEAVECLALPESSREDGATLLALCDELPAVYANSTVVRGYRAIGLSRSGRVDEARAIMDLENYVAQVTFEPPPGFGGIDGFNSMLAEEIRANPDLRVMSSYGFRRTERLNVRGARAYPELAKFLRAAMMRFIDEFRRRGLDKIMPDPPRRAYLTTAGNLVHNQESHRSHLHKFAYISGVYHVSAPHRGGRGGALVLGSFNQIAQDYAPCWGARIIEPRPGVATIFPSHIFHSVASTGVTEERIAVPFDLCPVEDGGESSFPSHSSFRPLQGRPG
jgi:tetratricopeptide (TPR) repeat protein